MNRPLWQILLTIFVVAFVLRRGVSVYLFAVLEDDTSDAIWVPYAIQMLAGLVFAAGLWSGRRWMFPALIALGVLVAATGLYEAFFLGVVPPVYAVGQVLVAALATGALLLILRHEFSGDGPGPEA